MAVLWICEKYSVASELAHVLFDGVASHNPPTIVTKRGVRLAYTNGHALEMASPELYDPTYKSWEHDDIAGLALNGFRLVAAAGKSAAVSAIEAEIRTASEIVVATDAGREGEMIAWELLDHSRPDWIETPVIRAASYDDGKLTDHHAIIPTGMVPDLTQRSSDEAELYQLIVRHAVANLLPDHLYDSTTVTAVLGGKPFRARSRTTREPGWRSLMAGDLAELEVTRARKRGKSPDTEEADEAELIRLPPIEDGRQGTVREATAVEKLTSPPAYFTQASLLDAMVNIDLYLDDPGARNILGGPSSDRKLGIGTGATRAHIIQTLFDRGYIEERGTAIHATARGSAFIGLARRLVPWMVDPLHSAEQEVALRAIEAGEGSDGAYVSEVISRTRQTLSKLHKMGDTTLIEDEPAPTQRQTRRRDPVIAAALDLIGSPSNFKRPWQRASAKR